MTFEIRSVNSIRRAKEALREGDYNHDATYVSILFYSRFVDNVSVEEYVEDLLQMMHEVGKVANLRTLRIATRPCYDEEDTHPLPVKSVAAAIEQADQLEKLSIKDLCLIGTEQDFDRLAAALEGHASLKKARFTGCTFRGKGSWTNSSSARSPIETMVQTLGTIPSLETVKLVGGNYSGQLQASTIANLCQLPRLKSLKLLAFVSSNEVLASMASHLTTKSNRLTKLWLGGKPLTSVGCKRLGEILSCEHSKIEKLHLNVRGIDESEEEILLFQCLADALQGATCKSLRLDVPENHILVALEYTKQMLRTNYRLEELDLYKFTGSEDSADGGLGWRQYDKVENEDELTFLLNTNRIGRGKLYRCSHDIPVEPLWLKMFEAAEGDLGKVFLLVGSDPVTLVDILRKTCIESIQSEQTGKAISERSESQLLSSTRQAVIPEDALRTQLLELEGKLAFSRMLLVGLVVLASAVAPKMIRAK